MVSDAAKAVLTVMLFTNHRLTSGFVTFNSNSSDPSDSPFGHSFFARYASNYSEPNSNLGGYPATSTDEYMSTNERLSESTATPDDSNNDDRNVLAGVSETAGIHMPMIDDHQACLSSGKSSMGQFCQRRFDWIDRPIDSNWSETNSTSRRRKRSTASLKHGCCISETKFVTYSTYPDYKGTVRNLALIDGKAQYFAKDTCSHNETCTRCQHCNCKMDYIYQHALYTEVQDEQGRDVLQLGMFRFPHICRCINI